MERVRKIGLFFVFVLVFCSLLLVVPLERIYIKESRPTQFLPGERPLGLLEAYNYYIAISYGTLLNMKEKIYYAQFFRFNSSDYASTYFSKLLEELKKVEIEFELKPFDNGQKIIITDREKFGVFLCKENKLFYFSGEREKVDKVIEWLVKKNL